MSNKKSVGLSQVNYSMNGESEADVLTQQEDIARIASNDGNENFVKPDYIIFKLVDTKKKGGTYIPNIDEVINPKTGKLEGIRLLRGCDTIWMKEQKDITVDYVRQNSRSLEFPRGAKVLRIPTWDTAALEFAQMCRHNIGSPNRKTGSKFEFFEYNPQKQAQEALKREELELDMAILVKELPMEKVKKYAIFLKIPFNDEIGEAKNDDTIRRDLMMYAKRNATLFEQLINNRSKEVEVHFLVKKAILSAKIDIGSRAGKAFWANGGGLICAIPPGAKNPAEFLTEMALTNNEEGRQFLQQLNDSIK
jgi:hypothetical protein